MRRPHRKTESRLSIRFAPKPVRLTHQRRKCGFCSYQDAPLFHRPPSRWHRAHHRVPSRKQPAISWAEAG